MMWGATAAGWLNYHCSVCYKLLVHAISVPPYLPLTISGDKIEPPDNGDWRRTRLPSSGPSRTRGDSFPAAPSPSIWWKWLQNSIAVM